MSTSVNPLLPWVERQGFVVLDGGLATELESRGLELDPLLWSAALLMKAPDEIRRLHLDYLEAGADCVISASYQATPQAFLRQGLELQRAKELLLRSVQLAVEARELFSRRHPDESRPRLVAASIGPYGAYLADGSEYRGDYGLDEDALRDFHRERWHILAESDADLLACETIPSLPEAAALLSLLEDSGDVWAWLSFSCRDGLHLNDGHRFSDAVRLCGSHPRVAAVAINCTAPEHVGSLIAEARAASDKPVLAYPNRGERYDPVRRTWIAASGGVGWETWVREWWAAGAVGLGGCCRIGPKEIATTRGVLNEARGG